MGDYENFLRQHDLPIWDENSLEALAIRHKYRSDQSDKSDWSDLTPPRKPQ